MKKQTPSKVQKRDPKKEWSSREVLELQGKINAEFAKKYPDSEIEWSGVDFNHPIYECFVDVLNVETDLEFFKFVRQIREEYLRPNNIDNVVFIPYSKDEVYKVPCVKCNNKAVWMYLPSDGTLDIYYCDDHVPRGCMCNGGTWKETPLKDKQGRLLPCCEFDYQEEGFWLINEKKETTN